MQSISRQAQIRPFRADDVNVAAQILRESPGAANWSPAGREMLQGDTGVIALVCEVDSSVIGFLIARQVADEAEILNLAVNPQSRRTGHGSALLRGVLQAFQQRQVARAFLEVRESNVAAIAFYHKHGFVPTGRRNAYYSSPQEDALIMVKKLTA
jgi:[ribosomal protein S18]-alanine N-acetyltransferase